MSALAAVLRLLARRLLSILLPVALAASAYLYLYPIFHGCAFPVPARRGGDDSGPGKRDVNPLWSTVRQHVAPGSVAVDEPAVFRLLVLADPQLEGDSSLPSEEFELLARMRRHWGVVKGSVLGSGDGDNVQEKEKKEGEGDDGDNVFLAISAVWEAFVYEDIPRTLGAARKRLDLLGNDYYLAHIYRTLHWWTRPSHVTVLGDLIGSQWVTDGEFERRGSRFWDRVFRGGERVSDEITRTGKKGYQQEKEGKEEDDSRLEQLERGNSTWTQRIINVAGNHDIGYSGDVSETRLERFERLFGRANWDVRFQHPVENQDGDKPTLHVINLNTLTLDSPALSSDIRSEGYGYINDLIAHRTYPVEDRTTFTLLLTHLPLHKEDGICTDGPYFKYHDSDDNDGPDGVPRFKEGGLQEQNHLSDELSAKGVLEGIFGLSGNEDSAGGGRGRNGLILTGHDHTGCDVVHFVDRSNTSSSTDDHDDGQTQTQEESQPWTWQAKRYHHATTTTTTTTIPKATPSIREVTLRSMMGEFGGNAGLLSLWFDADPAVNEWKYEITMCAAGVQHIWWAVHVVDIVTMIVFLVFFASGSSSSSSVKVDGGQTSRGKGRSPGSQPRVNGNGKDTDKEGSKVSKDSKETDAKQ